MALRSIWHHAEDHPPTTRQKLNRDAISALFWVILTALLGIIFLAGLGALLRYGVFGDAGAESQSVADEALSILGNIGSAAIGGLVGWLTRDQLEQRDDTVNDSQELLVEPETITPIRYEQPEKGEPDE